MRVETIGDATLYCGDYRDVLPTLGKVDAVVTDPPYGIGFNYKGQYKDDGGVNYQQLVCNLTNYPRVVLQYPEETMRFLVPLWGAPDDCYAWCYNSNTMRQFRLWSFWGIKPQWANVPTPAKNPTDARVANTVRSYDWCSDIQQVKNVTNEKTDHPCQIPEELVCRIVLLTGSYTILDPFMGSGTTGVACARLGRSFIGIELEPRYFDIACRRIEAEYRQPRMFVEPPTKAVQGTML